MSLRLLRILLVLLTIPIVAAAAAGLVPHEIRYAGFPEGDDVELIWGVNGWNTLPLESQSAHATIENNVMHTPMVWDGGEWTVRVDVPGNARISFGFKSKKSGAYHGGHETRLQADEASPAHASSAGKKKSGRRQPAVLRPVHGLLALFPFVLVASLLILLPAPRRRGAARVRSSGEGDLGIRLEFSPSAIVRGLTLAALLLVALNLLHQLAYFGMGSDLDGFTWRIELIGDRNVGTWFSSLLLLLCALTFSLIATSCARRERRFVWHWRVLALLFVLLSVDDTATIHEWSQNLLGELKLRGMFYYSWVIFGAALVITMSVFYLRFFFALPTRTRRLFFLAAVLFVGGALGMEMFNASYASESGSSTLRYALTSTIEEVLELVGLLLLLFAALEQLRLRGLLEAAPLPTPTVASQELDIAEPRPVRDQVAASR